MQQAESVNQPKIGKLFHWLVYFIINFIGEKVRLLSNSEATTDSVRESKFELRDLHILDEDWGFMNCLRSAM